MAIGVKSNRGFSLLELMVALVIIGISIISLMQLSVAVLNNNLRNDIRNAAIEILSGHVNDLVSEPFDNISIGSYTLTKYKIIRSIKKKFTILDNITFQPIGSIKIIDSKVKWKFRDREYQYKITTVVAKE